MGKLLRSLGSLGILLILLGYLTSCKDDPEPAKPKLTFSTQNMTVNEADGTIEIELVLDKAYSHSITVDYTLSGSAIEKLKATQQSDPPDYEITSDYGEVDIPTGSTSGIIELNLYSDDLLEDDETIKITVSGVDEDIDISAVGDVTITIEQEDGLIVYLSWPVSSTDAGFVDMDLFVRMGKAAGDWDGIITGSIYRSYEIDELTFLPKTFTGTLFGLNYTNSVFGCSYTYYDGTRDTLDFTVTFAHITNGELEPEGQWRTDSATYYLNNRNKWSGSSYPTQVVQTFKNVGGDFVEFSSITTPADGSRTTVGSSSDLIQLSSSGNLRPRSFADLPLKYRRQLKLE